MSLLGIDLGTNSCKAVVFSIGGTPLATASYGYKTYSPQPGFVEIDANLFWEAVVRTVREVAAQTQDDPVTALAFSTQGETMIAVDRDGMPIRPTFMNADNRGTAEIRELCGQISKEDLYQITGEPAHTMYGVSELMWFKKHEPELYRKAAKLVSCEDFLMMRLGFEPLCNYSSCCRTFMLDIRRRDWSDEILTASGLDREKLGTPVPSGTLVGRLSRETAELLGLHEGVAVVTGGHDCPCSAFGSGALSADTAADQAGSYEGITIPVVTPNTSREALAVSLNTYCHVLKDQYLSLALFPAGFATSWYLSELAAADYAAAQEAGVSVYDYLSAQVAALGSAPTDIFFMPHFVGACNPYNDVRSTGTVIGLTPHTTRHKLYKAIYEGIACAFWTVTSVLDEHAGHFSQVRINGGGGKARFSLELRAALAGKTMLQLQCDEAGCLGAAMLAGLASGVYASEEDAVKQAVHVITRVEPDPELAAHYESFYQAYSSIYPSLEALRVYNAR